MSKPELLTKLNELTAAKRKAIEAGNIEKATIIRAIEKEIQKELDDLKHEDQKKASHDDASN